MTPPNILAKVTPLITSTTNKVFILGRRQEFTHCWQLWLNLQMLDNISFMRSVGHIIWLWSYLFEPIYGSLRLCVYTNLSFYASNKCRKLISILSYLTHCCCSWVGGWCRQLDYSTDAAAGLMNAEHKTMTTAIDASAGVANSSVYWVI